MERNCDKCIHHTSGMCDSWDCKMQTVEDVKKEAVNEYVKSVVAELEELKDYRDKNKMVVRVDVENMDSIKDKIEELSKYAENQYNKAIDDFAEKLKLECREHYVDCDPYFGGITDSILYEDDIDEIAEQLKAGGENEQGI